MDSKPEPSRVHRLLPVAAGVVLVSTAFFLDVYEDSVPGPVGTSLVVSGCVFVVLGIGSRNRRFSAALAKASLVILSSTLWFAAFEALFRVAGFDFERFNEPGDEVPIYYRQPTLHAGGGIFRRPGPASWRGRVISAYLRIHGTSAGPYADERPVLAEYDAFGFRNPMELTNWEVVVTGDSFVELGYLPYEDLFTTLAAKRLGLRIKNLGVSCTGPISQTFYVTNYGKAASTKDAVLCFFEGNDLQDLDREIRNTESFRATGHPWEHQKQVSLLKALCDRFGTPRRTADLPVAQVTPNAFLIAGNQERPTTVYGVPPAWDRISPRRQEAVVRALANWAAAVRSMGMRPWVMYLPDSHRVFHGWIRFTDPNSPMARWKPGEFVAHLGAACTNLAIGFIDTLPALRREVEAGRLPYNLVGDTHLSVEGTRVVADVLAERLKPGQAGEIE